MAIPEPNLRQTTLRDWLLSVALFAASLGIFAPSIGYPFCQLDDQGYVRDNPHVHSGLNSKNAVENLSWAFTTGSNSNWHPLTWISLQLDSSISYPNAWAFHLTNVLMHAVNAMLFFWVWRLMTGCPWRAAAAAALWAIHPLRVESVVWITERKDTLSTLFWLLAMLAYLRYAHRPSVFRYVLVAVMLACGLMSKPMLVTLPAVFLLLDYWPLGRYLEAASRGQRPLTTFFKLVLEKVPLMAVVVASAIITIIVQSDTAIQYLSTYTMESRVKNAFATYLVYILDSVRPTELAPYYPYVFRAWTDPKFIGGVLLLVFGSTICIHYRYRFPYLPVGWFWYLGTLVPVIGLVQVGEQSHADRYTYVSVMGLLIALVWGIADLMEHLAMRMQLRAAIFGIVLALFGALTLAQSVLWSNHVLLWSHTLEVTSPDNKIALHNLGTALDMDKRHEESLAILQRFVHLDPKRWEGQASLAIVLFNLGRYDEAIAAWKAAGALNNNDPAWRRQYIETMGKWLPLVGRGEEAVPFVMPSTEGSEAAARMAIGLRLMEYQFVSQAREQFEKAALLVPTDVGVLFHLAMAQAFDNRYDDAERTNQKILALNPNHAQAHAQLGLLAWRRGTLNEAESQCREAVRASPQVAEFHADLALVLGATGKTSESKTEYAQADRLTPQWSQRAAEIAWNEATKGKPGKSLFPPRYRALEACEATQYANPAYVMALAAVEAADGKFKEAVVLLEKAKPLVERARNFALLQQIDEQLAKYRTGRSLREQATPSPSR